MFDAPPNNFLDETGLGNLPFKIITPYWTNNDLRQSGEVYYRTSCDNEVLSVLAAMIAVQGGGSIFNAYMPTECAIVTWSRPPLLENSEPLVSKQFQLGGGGGLDNNYYCGFTPS